MFWIIVIMVLGVIGLFAINTILIVVAGYISAEQDWQLSRPLEGHIGFKVKGEDLDTQIVNVDGYRLSKTPDQHGRYWIVPSDTPTEESSITNEVPWGRLGQWLWKRLGIMPVSLLYPQIRLKEFKIEAKRLKEHTGGDEILKEEDWIENEGMRPTKWLRFMPVRPLIIRGVELPGDGTQVDIVIQAIFHTVIPSIPVFLYKGGHYPRIDAMIEAGVIDFCATYKSDPDKKPLDYQGWIELKKGPSSDLDKYMRSLNASQSTIDELDEEKAKLLKGLMTDIKSEELQMSSEQHKTNPQGFVTTFGLAMINFRVVSWYPNPSTAGVASARRNEVEQQFLAKGVMAKAQGDAEEIRLKGQAEADAFKAMVDTICAQQQGVTREDAAKQVLEMRKWEFISNSNLTHIVGGTGGNQEKTPPVIIQ